MINFPIRKTLASLIVALFFAQNVLLAHAAESTVWQQRHSAVEAYGKNRGVGSPPPSLLAALPAIEGEMPHPFTRQALADIGLNADLQFDEKAPRVDAVVPPWLQAAVAPYAAIHQISLSKIARAKTVLLLQDVHLHTEAQTNIAGVVGDLGRSLQARNASLLVGMEGADIGKVDFSAYNAYPHRQALRQTAEALLKANIINGIEYAAIGYDGDKDKEGPVALPFTVTGIESRPQYLANVKTIRDAAPLKDRTKKALADMKRILAGLKKTHYSPELAKFDARLSSYQEGKASVADYMLYMDSIAPAMGRNARELLEAALLEDSIDFKKVERERTELLKILVAKLSEGEIKTLLRIGALFTSGGLSSGGYYDHVKRLARRHEVDLSAFPDMGLYIQYILKSEHIDPAALFDEIKTEEEKVIGELAATSEQKEVASLSRDYYLLGKLSAHILTDDEWQTYNARRDSIASINDRLASLKVKVPASLAALKFDLPVFEDFYRLAVQRNHTMADRLAERLNLASTNFGVLVAGGFHTEGLFHLLKDHGFNVLMLSPKITTAQEGGLSSIDILASGRLPLDQLFVGERLFIPLEPVTANPGQGPIVEELATAVAEAHRKHDEETRGRIHAGRKPVGLELDVPNVGGTNDRLYATPHFSAVGPVSFLNENTVGLLLWIAYKITESDRWKLNEFHADLLDVLKELIGERLVYLNLILKQMGSPSSDVNLIDHFHLETLRSASLAAVLKQIRQTAVTPDYLTAASGPLGTVFCLPDVFKKLLQRASIGSNIYKAETKIRAERLTQTFAQALHALRAVLPLGDFPIEVRVVGITTELRQPPTPELLGGLVFSETFDDKFLVSITPEAFARIKTMADQAGRAIGMNTVVSDEWVALWILLHETAEKVGGVPHSELDKIGWGPHVASVAGLSPDFFTQEGLIRSIRSLRDYLGANPGKYPRAESLFGTPARQEPPAPAQPPTGGPASFFDEPIIQVLLEISLDNLPIDYKVVGGRLVQASDPELWLNHMIVDILFARLREKASLLMELSERVQNSPGAAQELIAQTGVNKALVAALLWFRVAPRFRAQPAIAAFHLGGLFGEISGDLVAHAGLRPGPFDLTVAPEDAALWDLFHEEIKSIEKNVDLHAWAILLNVIAAHPQAKGATPEQLRRLLFATTTKSSPIYKAALTINFTREAFTRIRDEARARAGELGFGEDLSDAWTARLIVVHEIAEVAGGVPHAVLKDLGYTVELSASLPREFFQTTDGLLEPLRSFLGRNPGAYPRAEAIFGAAPGQAAMTPSAVSTSFFNNNPVRVLLERIGRAGVSERMIYDFMLRFVGDTFGTQMPLSALMASFLSGLNHSQPSDSHFLQNDLDRILSNWDMLQTHLVRLKDLDWTDSLVDQAVSAITPFLSTGLADALVQAAGLEHTLVPKDIQEIFDDALSRFRSLSMELRILREPDSSTDARADVAFVTGNPIDGYVLRVTERTLDRIENEGENALIADGAALGVALPREEARGLALHRFFMKEIGRAFGVDHAASASVGLAPDEDIRALRSAGGISRAVSSPLTPASQAGALQSIVPEAHAAGFAAVGTVEGESITPRDARAREIAALADVGAARPVLNEYVPNPNARTIVNHRVARGVTLSHGNELWIDGIRGVEELHQFAVGDDPLALMAGTKDLVWKRKAEVYDQDDVKIGHPNTLAIFDQKNSLLDFVDEAMKQRARQPGRYVMAFMGSRETFDGLLSDYIGFLQENGMGTELGRALEIQADLTPQSGLPPKMALIVGPSAVQRPGTDVWDVTALEIGYYAGEFQRLTGAKPERVVVISDWRKLIADAVAAVIIYNFNMIQRIGDEVKTEVLAAKQA